MNIPVARVALYGATVAVSQYALAPVLAMAISHSRPEPDAFAVTPTWTSEIWIASAIALGMAFAASWRFVATNSQPVRLLVVALSCTGVYVVATSLLLLPYLYGEWYFYAPLIALGFSGAAMLAFAITLIAGLTSRRPAGARAHAAAAP